MQETVRDYLAQELHQILKMLENRHIETGEIKEDLRLLDLPTQEITIITHKIVQ